MNFFDKKILEKLWWYGLNILTTLFIVSFINFNAPQGEPGVPGSNGTNGVDGENGQDGQDFSGQNLYPVSPLTYDPAPVGDARAAYAAELVEQGFIPLSSVEDFEIFSVSPFGTLEDGFYGNEAAYENNYVLTADIDFSGEDMNYFGRRIAGFVMNDFQQSYVGYSGTFDGAGYTIKNFDLAVGEYNFDVGFFPFTLESVIRNINFENHSIKAVLFDGDAGGLIGSIDGKTIIQNVTMTNLEVVSDGNSGGLVGRSTNAIYILNSQVTLGSVFGTNTAGGLIGQTSNNYTVFIQDSVNRATIDDSINPDFFLDEVTIDNAGGFIGEITDNESTIILNSINDGLIRNNNEAGGFIGLATYSETLVIANSYNNGFIYNPSEGNNEAAGFIADLDSPFAAYIQNSYNTAQIYGTNSTAGFVGELGDDFDDENGDSLEDYQLNSLFITNSYNAGSIMTGDGETGGFVGEVNNSRNVVIQNSFNVGQFSRSVTLEDLEDPFRDNGAFIGDATGTQLLDNSVYYVDLEDVENYLTHAIDGHLDVGATQIHDHSRFTDDDFIFSEAWDFDNVWTFSNTNYPYPIIQELNLFNVKPVDENWLPEILDHDLWMYEENLNEETNQNEIDIIGFYAYATDVDSASNEVLMELYITLDNEIESAAVIQTSGQKIYEISNTFIAKDFDQVPINFVPNAGTGTYFIYVVVTDKDGNQTFDIVSNSIEYKAIEPDSTAPVPGGSGIMGALVYDFPRDVAVYFEEATDDVTASEDLDYFVIVAVDGFDYDSWDLNWNNPNVLHAALTPIAEPGIIRIRLDFDVDDTITYLVALYVQDAAGNLARYTPSNLLYDN